jgi:ribosomal protein L10
MPSQQVLEAKSTEVDAIKDILKEYKSIGIASLKKVRASQLQDKEKHGCKVTSVLKALIKWP